MMMKMMQTMMKNKYNVRRTRQVFVLRKCVAHIHALCSFVVILGACKLRANIIMIKRASTRDLQLLHWQYTNGICDALMLQINKNLYLFLNKVIDFFFFKVMEYRRKNGD